MIKVGSMIPTPEQIAEKEYPASLIHFIGARKGVIKAYSAVAKELRKIIFNDRIYKEEYDKLLKQLDGEKEEGR